ncbi:hypothetical protein IAR50_001185 [Cryptococcus sp. DSM 104548]
MSLSLNTCTTHISLYPTDTDLDVYRPTIFVGPLSFTASSTSPVAPVSQADESVPIEWCANSVDTWTQAKKMFPGFQPLPSAAFCSVLCHSQEEEFVLGKLLSRCARWKTCAVEGLTKVAKMVRLIDFPVEEYWDWPTQREIRRGVYREMCILTGLLKHLQGNVVPQFYGLYTATRTKVRYLDDTDYEEVWLAVMERPGDCPHDTIPFDEDWYVYPLLGIV